MVGWVAVACRHCTASCTFKGEFKAGLESWALTLGSGVITVAITGAGLGLGGLGYSVWAGL